MLHSIFIISDDTAVWPPAESKSDGLGIHFSYLARAEKLKEAYHFFSNRSPKPFSLSVTATDVFTPAFLQSLAAFMFIPGYCRINNKTVVNLLAVDGNAVETSRQQITEGLAAQGIQQLQVNHIATGIHQPADEAYPLFENSDQLLTVYADSLSMSALPSRLFFFRAAKNDTGNLTFCLRKVDEQLQSTHALLYSAAMQIQLLEAENAAMEKRNGALDAELLNYQAHLETIRSSHEAKSLQAYYDKEYEILPLWYKRLGQIVKVLTGKRRLRSLFDDQTKKYKD